MKKVLVEFGGAIIFYIVIFFGIVAITTRISHINDNNITVDKIAVINK